MMARFCTYCEKVFALSDLVGSLTEPRDNPMIPLEAFWAATFAMYATARNSLNALDIEMKIPKRLDGVVGARKPSGDRLGEVYELVRPDEQRKMLLSIVKKLRRNKALNNEWPYVFVALDGHEFFRSKHRSWDHCSTRTIHLKDTDVTEYYQRGVVAHLVGFDIPVPLDVEMILPGEDEIAAAKRVTKRLTDNYPELFDGVIVDALYFEAPFVNFCLDLGKHVVGVVKGKDRLLLQDAEGVFSSLEPEVWKPRPNQQIEVWEAEGFKSFDGVDEAIRVLHTQETTVKRERIDREWTEKVDIKNWWWFSTLPTFLLPTHVLWEVGHARWEIEDDLFNVLVSYWGMNHCFRYHPVAMVNFILTLFITFILLQCFYCRNLKPQMRKRFSTIISFKDELHGSLPVAFRFKPPWLCGGMTAPMPP